MFAKMKPNLRYAAALQNSGPSSEVEVTCRQNAENGSHRIEKVDVGGRQPSNTDDFTSSQSAIHQYRISTKEPGATAEAISVV